MRIAVWGAGEIGTGLVYRLATTPYATEIYWITRTYKNIISRVIDIEQGLALCPACKLIRAIDQIDVHLILKKFDVLVLTLGSRVDDGVTREDLYTKNRDVFRASVVPVLSQFKGIIIVVTNPVDLMARLLHVDTGFHHSRIIGLGTVVETARLRYCLSSYFIPKQNHREISAYAIGTHNKFFVPVIPPDCRNESGLDPVELERIIEHARREVNSGPQRAKQDGLSTRHPIIEGINSILTNIAEDRKEVLTVSTLDPDNQDNLFYSMPCVIGSIGIIRRENCDSFSQEAQEALKKCTGALRIVLDEANGT